MFIDDVIDDDAVVARSFTFVLDLIKDKHN